MSSGKDIDWAGAMQRARAHAPFLAMLIESNPDLAALLAAGEAERELVRLAQPDESDMSVATSLRGKRKSYALVLAIGDLAGAFPLKTVTHQLSRFADFALDEAIREAIGQRVECDGTPGFIALALGKHGAFELNYSSDIDPIFLFDPETLPRRERDDPAEAAQRYARRIVELLTEKTREGYVFRVDLRLRPASEASPLAISIPAALSHYESSALAWERAAFIRARACAGDIEAGERFLQAISPFVWRRSLDFTAIEEIRRLTARIRDTHSGPPVPGPGFNLKQGRGGIREIEFFALTHQLIHGGRHPALRQRGVRSTLGALAEENIIPAADARILGESYDRLRTVEHRLQMINDRQTHSLPDDPAGIDNVAQLDGLDDGRQLLEELGKITSEVALRYDALLGTTDERAGPRAAPMEAVDHFADRLDRWRDTMRTLRSPEARAAFAAMRRDLGEAIAAAPDPERAFVRLESVIERMPTAINLFRLFEARPGLLDQVLRIVTVAEPLADELSREPGLLDTLIDATVLDLPGTVDELADCMREKRDAGYEDQLDAIRRVVSEARFSLAIQLVEARRDPLEISAALAELAEAAIMVGARAASDEFARVHGRIDGSDLVLLGLGRLGGGALTHASDLDVVYLFDGGFGESSDGDRPLTASLYYNRLAQRVTAALSVPTAAGALYEIDTRLRPQGAQGPIAVSLESFEKYQRESAWTWEHMALIRARPVFGPPDARRKLQSMILDVLDRERDPGSLRADVLSMREEMARHKAPAGPLDAKLSRGGLVDCEFIVHYLQLRERVAFDPDMGTAIDLLMKGGLLPQDFRRNYDLLSRLLVSARLITPDAALPHGSAQAILAAACGAADMTSLLQEFASARHGVIDAWSDIFGEQLEQT